MRKVEGKEKKEREKSTQARLPGFELALLDQLLGSRPGPCLKLHHAANETNYKMDSINHATP